MNALLVAACFAALLQFSTLSNAASPSKQLPSNEVIVNIFMTSCTGAPSKDRSAQMLAYVNCLGRLDGFAHGHEMTVQLYELANQDFEKTNRVKIPRAMSSLWCIPPDVDTARLFEDVLGWATVNKSEFITIMQQYPGKQGSVAVMIKALHRTYPCK